MRVDFDNYKTCENKEDDQNLLHALLLDVEELNNLLDDKDESYRHLYVDKIDDDNDMYKGFYRLKFEKNPYESVGMEMDIHQLDDALCVLINFIEFKLS